MKRRTMFTHEFVEYIPDELKEGIIYVSVVYATAAHKCCCGCGNKVVTPFSPIDWTLIYDGRSISLDPSIGNWEFPCRSHYWITRNQIHWARQWSREEIDAGKGRDLLTKRKFFNQHRLSADPEKAPRVNTPTVAHRKGGFRRWLRGWLR